MDNLIKNATGILLALAFVGLGVYLYMQQDAQMLESGLSEQSNLMAETAVFLERRRLLEQANLDLVILENPTFRSLVSYTTPTIEPPIGRVNPFDRVSALRQ